MLKRISVAVFLVQLILLFSAQYYYANPVKICYDEKEILAQTQMPFSDCVQIPSLDHFVLDEKKGQEKKHSGNHDVHFQSRFSERSSFHKPDDYGVHTQPTRNHQLRSHLVVQVLLI